MQIGHIQDSMPTILTEEAFTPLLQHPHARIERIVSHGHCSPPDFWYDQNEDEWVMVVQGEAQLELQDPQELVSLRAGMWIWLPAHKLHRVAWTTPHKPTIWLAVFLPPQS